ALLRPIEPRQLLGDGGLEQQVFSLLRAFSRAAEVFRGFDVILALAGDDSHVAENFAAPRWRDFPRQREQWLDALLGLVESASRDAQLNLIERDVHLVRTVMLLAECLCRRRVCGFCLIELTEVGIRQADVVENLRRVVEHAESSVAGEASLKRLECSPNVAPDAGDR